MTKASEEKNRILRQKIGELEEQLGCQMKLLDESLDELLESKIILENQLQGMNESMEDKNNEIAQLEEAVTKLESQLKSADKKAVDEKTRAQRLQSFNEKLEQEKLELQGDMEELANQVKYRNSERAKVERELKEQCDLVQELQRKCSHLENLSVFLFFFSFK